MIYKHKPTEVEAITFDELVEYGLKVTGARPLSEGMPWNFLYKRHHITQKNGNCYFIPTLEGTMNFKRGDMLITGVSGEIYPIKQDIFNETYDPV